MAKLLTPKIKAATPRRAAARVAERAAPAGTKLRVAMARKAIGMLPAYGRSPSSTQSAIDSLKICLS